MTRFTLYGLYQYDSTLFDDVLLPTGLDKEACINNIIDKSGDLYCYYQVPERAKSQITRWFEMHFIGFERMITALLKEYNPIENTDRYEEENEINDITRNNTASGSDSAQSSGSDETETQVEQKTSAFDSSDYQPQDLNNGTDKTTYGRKDTNTYERVDDSTTNDTSHRVLHTHGNIGVTTNQQMIRDELELRVYNIYDVIASMFENDILIQIY